MVIEALAPPRTPTPPHPILTFNARHADREVWRDAFVRVRADTLALASHLTGEDMVVQAMPDASPTKWHLAHVTWFFETFVLARLSPGYEPFNTQYGYLFNSYYEAVGPRWARPKRGLLSRPTVSDIMAYRRAVDERVLAALDGAPQAAWEAVAALFELGLHHEQQHQELLVTDIKIALGMNPLMPAVFPSDLPPASSAASDAWIDVEEGLFDFGADGEGFAFDNEMPRHRQHLRGAQVAAAPLTNADVLAFIEDDGYARAELWLYDGWDWVRANEVRAPLYWRRLDDVWVEYTAHGPTPLRLDAIACHLSAYEAHAIASWTGCRLPTEFELEMLARDACVDEAQLLEPDGLVHPFASAGDGPRDVMGGVWEWSASAYVAYPGYRTPRGAVGEYNGKFMSGQLVLRGGSVATPRGHARATYRNFFAPHTQWQFSGVRLARDVD